MRTSHLVYLVPMTDSHLATTCDWLQKSAELRDQVDCLTPPTEEGNKAYWEKHRLDRTREDYAIVSNEGVHVGNCGLTDIDLQRHKAELWLYLGLRRNSGLGSLALRQLLARGFGELRLNRIWLRVLASNPAAERFYARHGFVVEGRLRQDTVQNGRAIDTVVMALLAADCQGRWQ